MTAAATGEASQNRSNGFEIRSVAIGVQFHSEKRIIDPHPA